MTDLAPDLGLFSIMGPDRRVEAGDMGEFEIIRLAVTAISDSPEPEPTAAWTRRIATTRARTVHVMYTNAARRSTTDVNGSKYSVGYEIL